MDKTQKSSDAKDRTPKGRTAYPKNFVIVNRAGSGTVGQDCRPTQLQQISSDWNDCRGKTAIISARELAIGGILEALIEEIQLELADIEEAKRSTEEKESTLRSRLDHLIGLRTSLDINQSLNEEE